LKAEALYDYEAQAADELGFTAGQMLSVSQQDPSGWWECSNGTSKGVRIFCWDCVFSLF
jgi:hypothetical protein